MKKVFIKYNPYKLETDITVDGRKLPQNSQLREKAAVDSRDEHPRLQEWVEELPHILIDEYNDTDFEIEFHGTLLDYEDLTSVITDAKNHGAIMAKCVHIPAKETSDKEALIDDVFTEIQNGPFEDLRDKQLISAFKHAKSEDFEVCVVATMSAGKSTLINAMLGQKLMPSKQEACTAIITRIKDISSDNIPFKAKVYDNENGLLETHENLTLPIMERLNSDVNVSVIEISGNIPFVSSDDVSLVLIDTPGPNNARDMRHRKVQSEFLGKSSKTLVLYIMTPTFTSDDDNALLNRVAENMAVGGKQSKDRFIFVVNKLDDRKKEDGDTNQTLERVRSHLKTHGIANPNLFPAAAEPALYIRMIMSGADVDDDTVDRTKTTVRILNRNSTHHFDNYATLPAGIRGEIKGQLDTTRSEYKGLDNENQNEALIHTGVVSIEAAIRQYVQKYAKTAKIKNIVDTFNKKLEELNCFEKTKNDLVKHQEEKEKIIELINSILRKIESGEEAKKFKDAVDDAVKKVNDESKVVVENIIRKFQSRIAKRILKSGEREIDPKDVEDEVKGLEKYTKELEPDFEVELDELVRTNLVDTSNALLNEYKNKLASLTEEIDAKNLSGLTIDPLKLMSGSITRIDLPSMNLERSKTIQDGLKTIEVPHKPILGLGIRDFLFGYIKKEVPNYKEVKYVRGDELAQAFFSPVQQSLYDNGDNAIKYARQQSKKIVDSFNIEFRRLDDMIKTKLNELKSYATDKEKVEERIRETEYRLEWLKKIISKVESILEI